MVNILSALKRPDIIQQSAQGHGLDALCQEKRVLAGMHDNQPFQLEIGKGRKTGRVFETDFFHHEAHEAHEGQMTLCLAWVAWSGRLACFVGRPIDCGPQGLDAVPWPDPRGNKAYP